MSRRLPSAPPILSGYTYVRPLGTGGFADVFLFEQNLPRRPVAVKVLLRDIVDDNVLRSFNSEADVMARLSSHPSILTVYNASISADGRPYLVMEFCPGSYASSERTSPLSVANVLHVAVKIAGALETAHRSRVLHRDIKPSNILSTSFHAPVLGDFGIAASLADGADNGDELFAMSLPWSAPEVIEERTTGTVATEVWSFGATVYSLLADRAPFALPDAAPSTRQQLQQRISRARYTSTGRTDAPASLETALAAMMSRDPAARPLSLLDCAQMLQKVEEELGLPVTALEVADRASASAGPAIDFANSEARGPVRSDVARHGNGQGHAHAQERKNIRSRFTSRNRTDSGRRQVSVRPLSWQTAGLLLAAALVGSGATVGVLLAAGML